MKNKLIVRIAEGLGNQLFMYAHAYCLSKFKVYHFGSITTRKSNISLNDGTKKFLLKWGFTPRFFRKHYLKGDDRIKYDGALSDVKVSLNVLIDLLINKLKFLYYKVLL